MADAIQVLRAALQDVWDELLVSVLVNLAWLFGLALVLPAAPATYALFAYGNRLAHGEKPGLSDFWLAFIRGWRVALRWGLVNLLLLGILVGDLLLTGQQNSAAGYRFWQGLYVAILAVWLYLQLYILPFLLEQQSPSLRLALRNGSAMLGRNIGFSLALALLLAGILAIGTLLFFFSLAAGGVVLAAAGNRAVLNRLEQERRPMEGNTQLKGFRKP